MLDSVFLTRGMSLCGQKAQERFIGIVLSIAGAIGFLVGAYEQSTWMMMLIVGAGVGVCILATGPPWKAWGEDDIQWVPRATVDKWLAEEYAKENPEAAEEDAAATPPAETASPKSDKSPKSGKRAGSPVLSKRK
eukprot:TRINITY_DN20382_c0_g1_i1.p2 TRINITY_DN20382_c0_g1~~TRINITY_DN20382_c0_g1_i1.p2  ORF type:complete len:135 (+),score=45.89 TRINITY_DN20382_c0_g1_i1:67-471(+)